MTVLVTGGAGYIGSHTCLQLLQSGYDIVVMDNFSNSQSTSLARVSQLTGVDFPTVTGDIRDKKALRALFNQYQISSVIHFAGLKAVGESTEKPMLYYDNNVVGSLSLFEVMAEFGVKTIVFSSSATVYGDPASVPIREDFPLSATNPYGQTKLMIEHMLRDIYHADNTWHIGILRYFNPIGAHESGLIGEDPNGIPNNLLPYVAQVAVGKLNKLRIFGNDYPTHDGTGVRDYIHVVDLAEGHLAALKYLEKSPNLLTVNLGTGIGYSVLDVVKAFSKESGIEIAYEFMPRRAGDVALNFADPTLAKTLIGWSATRNLAQMCGDTWRWQSNNPQGYKTE
ncbi:MAG: UDP-glucose 4-epimerase GalE [Methylophilaceae bacterium 17-44-8]|nr:MAG: UDP-glucose 4-epimerase GalE [Methylophilales bacterium 28-44-11]OZA06547.1 MAG: UDP-glucose 4-epimerase GalE [Methylophilaceae bacterium 17-44-8]